jgi:pyruvate dehydrogenase E2 component (dihydrolipoamide acetyltransferase)
MATEVILPRVDMDMAEGKVAHWYVKNGDAVRKGQVLFEIETDKATMEVDAPADGVMHGIRGETGVAIPVGQVIGWILAPGEAPPASAALAQADDAPTGAGAAPGAAPALSAAGPAAEPAEGAMEEAAGEAAGARSLLRATPLARSLARAHGIDLSRVPPSGPGGRVLARDLHSLAAPPGPAQAARPELHLQWLRHGTGIPLLLIHGFGADHGSWRPLLPHLPDARPVVAIDLPNHGKSALQPVRTLHDMVSLVLARLDAEGIGAFHALGHSLGGGVALALAGADPQRVQSLTLLAPAGLGPELDSGFIDALVRAHDEPALKAAMTALFHDPAVLTGSFVATAFQQLQSSERRLALAHMAQQLMPGGRQAQSLRQVLPGLKVPVQLVWGTGDRIIPMRHALDVPEHVGVHLLPAVGHLPQVEAGPVVAALVALQLRGLAEAA